MDRFQLGGHTRQISTSSAEAQKWFDFGLNWCFGFNHEEGLKCFRRALESDPECVMAHWGVAYGSGPFYNFAWRDFSPAEAEQATRLCHRHIRRALDASDRATDVENQLVVALASRFQKPHPVKSNEFDCWDDAYRDAMRLVYAQYPDDHDVMALFVEAMITRTPWKLWDVKTGLPADNADTIEALEVCEQSIAIADEQRIPQHPAILHLHIHLLEMSAEPERAMRSADNLRSLAFDAGHLNHMPGHIYVLCGQYDKARVASEKAILADDMYLDYAGPLNFYTSARCHDLHLMMYTCMFLGRYHDTIAAANRICDTLTPEVLGAKGCPKLATTLEGYYAMKMHAFVRFGRWQDALDEPLPPDPELYCVSTAMHHYAKGVANAALGNVAAAQEQRSLFDEARARIPEERRFFNNAASSVLGVGEKMLDGELAYRTGRFDDAFEHLRESVRRDDDLDYTEPWAWMHPPRHALAALLMEQGRCDEAETIYRADLGLDQTVQRCAQHPDNVWSLHGLVECLDKRGETVELAGLRQRLAHAMAHTDVAVTSSCLCRTDVRTAPSSD